MPYFPRPTTRMLFASGAALLLAFSAHAQLGKRFPSEKKEYTDETTGVHVTALTTAPGSDAKIYQTHPQWTADGRYIIFRSDRTANHKNQAFAVDEASGDIIQLTDGDDTGTGSLNVARLSNKLYYLRQNKLIELNLDPLLKDSQTGKVKAAKHYERTVAELPKDAKESGGFTLDADEQRAYIGLAWKENGQDKWAIRSIDLRKGTVATVIDLPFRVGHMQANPWVPGEILYCHETGGDAPQRMWLVRADGSENRPLYAETPAEWVTHEIWQDKDHVLFNLMGHLPNLRQKPQGVVRINIRNNEVQLLHQADGRGYWHCAGTQDGKLVVADTFTGELHLINAQTGEVKPLTMGHYPRTEGISDVHSHHTISPDGKRVLFNSGKLGSLDLMTAPIQ